MREAISRAMTAAPSECFQNPRRSVLLEFEKLLNIWNTDSLITSVLTMSVPMAASDCSSPTLAPLRW